MADFFELQDKAHTKTRTLVIYFLLAIICIVLAINVAVWFAGITAGMFAMPLSDWPYSSYSWLTTGAVLIVIFFASVIQSARLSSGGSAVAKMVGARHIKNTSRNTLERRLLNVVEEMSIASGMPMPTVYVMDEEQAINAFVAGLKPSMTALVVTRGCLEKLSRNELQGVVGHEFSHIFNSDMSINVRLIGILAGILFVGQMGYFLMRLLGRSGGFRSSRGSKNNSGNILLFVLVLGATLFAVGYIGLFFGRLIKASISRQREYLADASSVQFTRDVDGIADALVHIQQDANHGLLQNSHAEDMSHMCFQMPIKMSFSGLLATHPPIEDRVRALNPNYDFTQRKFTNTQNRAQNNVDNHRDKEPHFNQSQTATQNFATTAGFASQSDADFSSSKINSATSAVISSKHLPQQATADHLVASIGKPTDDNLKSAEIILNKIPQTIWQQSITDIKHSQLLIFSLLVHAEPDDWNTLKTFFKNKLTEQDFQQLVKWTEALLPLKGWIRLPLFNHVIPTLQLMTSDEKNNFFQDVLAIIKNNKTINLSEYLIYALLKHRLEPVVKRSRINSLKKIKTELEYLFATLVQASHTDPLTARQQFQSIMRQFALGEVSHINLENFDPVIVHGALLQISRLPPLLQKVVIQAMADCALWDKKVSIDEDELIRTVCDYLDAPVPVLIPESV